MKLLVTGSEGLVGSEAVRFFEKRGWDVMGIDNNMRSYFFNVPKRNMNEVDIRNEEDIDVIFNAFKPDAIIHAAAQPSHDWARKEPLTDFDVNARATLILLEATRKHCPEATFVFVSTDKVYGENMRGRGIPFDENLGLDFAGKRSLFGCSKAAADMYVQEYGNYFDMKTVCFRPGCITGKNHKGAEEHGFLAYLAKVIRNGQTYKIFGDGKTVRDQIHVYDLVSAFDSFIEDPKVAAVYNIGGGMERAVSVLDAGRRISKELNLPFNYEFHEERKGDRYWDVHDISKFQRDYPDWDYAYSLEDIIKDVCTV